MGLGQTPPHHGSPQPLGDLPHDRDNVHWGHWLWSFSTSICGPQGVLFFAHRRMLGRVMPPPKYKAQSSLERWGRPEDPCFIIMPWSEQILLR